MPSLQFVYAFSGVFGEAASLVPFQPTNLIFVGIDVLFTGAEGVRVSASYDALLELFDSECIGNFLKSLEIYTNISLSPLIMEIITKIMAKLISALALAAKKQIGQGRLRQFAKKLLGNSEVENMLRRLDRCTLEEARMTEAQIFKLEVVHGLMNNMKIVMDGGEGSTSAIRKILEPSKNHVIARGDHRDGSVPWFTQGDTFNKWDATGCLLWIHAGSGKSILYSTIIEEVRARRNAGLGLLAYFTSTLEVLLDLYSTHDAGSRQPDTKALVRCLTGMLLVELSGQRTIYLITDSLDECPNDSGFVSPREEVLDFVEDLIELHLPILRICVASRSEVDIRDVLEPLASYIVCLHDEDGQKQDIIDYINSVVQSDRKMRNWRVEDRQLVIDALTQRADGMFRWVFCRFVISWRDNYRNPANLAAALWRESLVRLLVELRPRQAEHTEDSDHLGLDVTHTPHIRAPLRA
ncbi:hypothetical protein EI94DRAFT_1808242 [Lactarius quietus]|nr:hypothetical protein EI94DRAFT_1808242 [Lactarius quietus]